MSDTDLKFSRLVTQLNLWAEAGERTTAQGTRLICPAPHVGRDAWLHILYRGLTESELSHLEEECPLPLPFDFQEFLRRANGFHLFSGALAIAGFRESIEREGDAAYQPYDLRSLNYPGERPIRRPPTVLIFGSTDENDNVVYFDTQHGTDVSRVGKSSIQIFKETKSWPNLWAWLLSEVELLVQAYDEKGVRRSDQ